MDLCKVSALLRSVRSRASGVVTGYSCAEEAFDAVLQAAREDLGNNKNFTVIRFNKVGD